MRALPGLVAVAALACSGRTQLGVYEAPTDASPAADAGACVDEVIATDLAGSGVVALDGTSTVWGTLDGQVWSKQGGNKSELASALDQIVALVADSAGLYFVSSNELRGGPRGAVVPIATLGSSGQYHLVANGRSVYVSDASKSDRVLAFDRDTRARSTVLEGLPTIQGLALDATYLYVASAPSSGGGTIKRVPLAGGPTDTIAEGLALSGRIAVDATDVFALDLDVARTHSRLLRVPKAGGKAVQVADLGPAAPFDLVVDDKDVFVSANRFDTSPINGEVQRVSRDGTKSEVWVTGGPSSEFFGLRADAAAVYWTTHWNSQGDGKPSVQKKCK